MWIGETVYFLSDRDGEFNLYSYDPRLEEGRAPHRARRLPDRERLGRRGQGDLRAGGVSARLRPGHEPVDAGSRSAWPPTWPRRVPGTRQRRQGTSASADISPTGKRAVLEYRGEIVTVPAKKGDPRNLTADARRARALARLVARRQVDRLFLRRLGRVRPAWSVPRTARARAASYPLKGAGLLRAARLVARQQEDRLHRQLPDPLLDRPGHRRGQAGRRRAGLQPDQDAELRPGRPTRSGSPTR